MERIPIVGSDNAFFLTPQQGLSDLRLIFNLETPPFDERAVRQAFLKGIDYTGLANDVMDGVYTPATGFFPPVVPYLVNNLTTDIAGAQSLLDAAGWLPRGDGIREKAGQPLSIVLVIYPQQPDLVPISTALQAQLRALGFEIQIQSVDDINEALRNDLIPWHAGLVFAGSLSFGLAPDRQLRRYLTSDGDMNHGGIRDAELDQLINELSATFDDTQRTQLLTRIQEIVIEEQAYQAFVGTRRFPFVVGPAYRDYVASAVGSWVTAETAPAGSP